MNDTFINTQITHRERQVLTDISYGFTIKEIAQRLHLSSYTIVSHKKRLCAKLHAANSPELVRKGFQFGHLQY